MLLLFFKKKFNSFYVPIYFQIVGLACFAVGTWMNIDKYPKSYFIIMVRDSNDKACSASTVMLIFAGICMFGKIIFF